MVVTSGQIAPIKRRVRQNHEKMTKMDIMHSKNSFMRYLVVPKLVIHVPGHCEDQAYEYNAQKR